jgi:hypothetical protein
MEIRSLSLLGFMTLGLVACGAGSSEGVSSSSSSSAGGLEGSSSSSSGTVYSSDPEVQAYCEDMYQRYGRSASSSGGPKYPLILQRNLGSQMVETANGDFEDPDVASNLITYITDPVLVYSGDSSVLIELPTEEFVGSVVDEVKAKLGELSVWLYSDSAAPVTVDMEINDYRFLCGGSFTAGGVGWETPRELYSSSVEVSSNVWAQAIIPINNNLGGANTWLSIKTSESQSAKLYIDDLKFTPSE